MKKYPIMTYEWMQREMIEAVKVAGYDPSEIYFCAGFTRTEQQKTMFFVMYFKDGGESLKAYWNPETEGRTIEVEFLGDRDAFE